MFLPLSIDLGHSEKYILSIRIKPDRFMFSISEPNKGKNFCLRETSFPSDVPMIDNIQRTIFDLNFLTQQFRQTNVVIVSKEYEVIPSVFFDSKRADEIYNFTHDSDGQVLYQENGKQKNVTLFNIEGQVYNFLSRNLFQPTFYHHTNMMIKLFENKGGLINLTNKMCLNFHNNILDIFCFSNFKLIHCLTYEDEPTNNQMYYILKLWEKCEFSQLTDMLYIAGKPDEEIKLALKEYIKNIELFTTPNEAFLWHEDALKTPLDLLALSL